MLERILVGKIFSVYILANVRAFQPVLYIGMTSDLARRIAEHRFRPRGFVEKYRLTTLVFFETTSESLAAIGREKQLKDSMRAKKIARIESRNPTWDDLLPAGQQTPRTYGGPSSLRSSG